MGLVSYLIIFFFIYGFQNLTSLGPLIIPEQLNINKISILKTARQQISISQTNLSRSSQFTPHVCSRSEGSLTDYYWLTDWLTYSLTHSPTHLVEHSPSWDANRFSPVKKFSEFYGTRRFITTFTSARHLSLSWARLIQSMPLPLNSWRSILIVSSHLRLGHPSGLFPSSFPTKSLYTLLLSPIRATHPAHLILLHLITRTILVEEYRSISSSLCSFLHSPEDIMFKICYPKTGRQMTS